MTTATTNAYQIGNIVLDDENNLCLIEQLSSQKMGIYQQVSKMQTKEICSNNIYSSNIYTVELTEEWLLKAGFEKISTNYQKGWLLLHGNVRTGTIDFLLNEPTSGKMKVAIIKYVHQLQNLYSSLSGEDLVFSSTEP